MKSSTRNRIRNNNLPVGMFVSHSKNIDEATTSEVLSAMVTSAKTLYKTKDTRDKYIDVLAKYAKRIMEEN